MSRKSTIDTLFGSASPVAADAKLAGRTERQLIPSRGLLGTPNTPPPSEGKSLIRTGAVRAIGESLQRLNDAGRVAADLQAQIANAQTLIEIDASLLDPAPVRDRLTLGDPRETLSLKQSIRENGQRVPILVRPHPVVPGRFQIAYGHRRAEACRELGIKARAIIASLSDEELIVAQGRENTERRDLSFIEVALFASRLEAAGHPRHVIIASLGLDKADVSRVMSVARDIPEELIVQIGPAPKAGRSRWMALAAALRRPSGRFRIEQLLADDGFSAADSDARLQMALAVAVKETEAGDQKAAKTVVTSVLGDPVATMEFGRRSSRLTINSGVAPQFAEFLAKELPALYERFEFKQLKQDARSQGTRRHP